jgi:hypothetical protein
MLLHSFFLKKRIHLFDSIFHAIGVGMESAFGT